METGNHPAGFASLVRKLALTCFSAFLNRGELFVVELQEEAARMTEFFLWIIITGMLGMLFLITTTATVVFLLPPAGRIYAAVVFCLVYLAGTVFAAVNLRALWKNAPGAFNDTIAEAKKDAEWLESLK